MKTITSYFYTDRENLIEWENDDAERKGRGEQAKGIEADARVAGVTLVRSDRASGGTGKRWSMTEWAGMVMGHVEIPCRLLLALLWTRKHGHEQKVRLKGA